MICSNCRRKLLAHLTLSNGAPFTASRFASRTPSLPQRIFLRPVSNTAHQSGTVQPSRQASSSSTSATPSALSSSTPGISQPLSTPDFPSSQATSTPPSTPPPPDPQTVKVKSSIAGGQELKGLGYTKAKPVILAKEDDEYPDWLWTLLDQDPASAGGETASIDVASMTKKQRARYEKKQAALQGNLPKAIPIHEQSINFTEEGASAFEHGAKAAELTKSMRKARRKAIKEDNYLRAM